MQGHITDLPLPPPNKTGWPWTVESKKPIEHDKSKPCPKVTIVTPSYQQGAFLEETIRSVVLQNYPNLEFILIDGASTDNTIDIIKKYEPWITYWASEKDRGQSHAINKGFEMASGDLGMWLCSDDLLCENAINHFAGHHFKGPDRIYLGKGYQIDQESKIVKEIPVSKIDCISKLVDLPAYWRAKGRDSILQQSVLYPVDAYKTVGGVSEGNYYTMDYELWGKLMIHGLRVERCNMDIGMFRWYQGQKTSFEYLATKELVETAHALLNQSAFDEAEKKRTRESICRYWARFRYHYFRSKIGIKRRIKKIINWLK